MTQTTKKSGRIHRLWGGFVNNKIDWVECDTFWGGKSYELRPAVFTNKAFAKMQYQDVRPISLKEIKL